MIIFGNKDNKKCQQQLTAFPTIYSLTIMPIPCQTPLLLGFRNKRWRVTDIWFIFNWYDKLIKEKILGIKLFELNELCLWREQNEFRTNPMHMVTFNKIILQNKQITFISYSYVLFSQTIPYQNKTFNILPNIKWEYLKFFKRVLTLVKHWLDKVESENENEE